MIDNLGVPEICLFQSDGINISVQMQNEFHDFVDTKYKIMKFILHLKSLFRSTAHQIMVIICLNISKIV